MGLQGSVIPSHNLFFEMNPVTNDFLQWITTTPDNKNYFQQNISQFFFLHLHVICCIQQYWLPNWHKMLYLMNCNFFPEFNFNILFAYIEVQNLCSLIKMQFILILSSFGLITASRKWPKCWNLSTKRSKYLFIGISPEPLNIES